MKIENCKLKIARCRGFTLIEMLVVIVVVAIGLVGTLSFYNININNQFEVKNELIAAGLAEEGVDLVRNLRDYNQSNGYIWYKNICTNNQCGNRCHSIDIDSLDSHACDHGNGHLNVKLDPTTKRYSQCASTDLNKTDFTRTISIFACDSSRCDNGPLAPSLDTAGNHMKVTVTVSWNGRTTTATDIIYNNNY